MESTRRRESQGSLIGMTHEVIVSHAKVFYNHIRIHQAEYLYQVVLSAAMSAKAGEPSAAYAYMSQHVTH